MGPAALVLAALALTGCSSSGSTPAVDKQAQFVASVHDAKIWSWTNGGPTDTQLNSYAEKWCTALNDGHTASYILSVSNGLYPSSAMWTTKKPEAVRVLVLAVTAYCPSQRSTVIEQLQSTGDW
jgi:hypothetical protein